MPGGTHTNFLHRADMDDTKAGAMEKKDDPADVAKAAWEALASDRDKVLPLLRNKVMGVVADALPDTTVAQIQRGWSEPGSANR